MTKLEGMTNDQMTKTRPNWEFRASSLFRNSSFALRHFSLSFGAQRLHWIDKRRATRGQQTREERGGGKQDGRAAEQCRVVGRSLIKLRCNQSTECKRSRKSDGKTDDHRSHSLIHNQPQHIARLGAERHSDADFTCSLLHRVSNC